MPDNATAAIITRHRFMIPPTLIWSSQSLQSNTPVAADQLDGIERDEAWRQITAAGRQGCRRPTVNIRSVECVTPPCYLGTYRLACEDVVPWLASSANLSRCCKARIRPMATSMPAVAPAH